MAEISTIFPQKAPNEFKALDDFEDFFCYLKSLGYTLSISSFDEMIKYNLYPYDENEYLVGINDMKHDNKIFFTVKIY